MLQRKLTHHVDPVREAEMLGFVQQNVSNADSPGSFAWAIATGRTFLANLAPGEAEAYHFCGHIYTTDSCPHPTGLPRIDSRGLPIRAKDARPVDDLGRYIDAQGLPVDDDGAPLTDADCATAPDGWLRNKGSSWWDGNYQNTLYNHYLTPNANRPDCIVYHDPGWKAARSRHPGGALALFADGHVAFTKDTIAPATRRALSTRAGGEGLSADGY